MTTQYSDAVINAMLDAAETATGVSPTLELRSGAKPATTATADSGTLLLSMALPSDWMAAATGRSKVKAGTWSGVGGAGAGAGTVAGHYRIKQGATCHYQGSITIDGGGGDMTLTNPNIAINQTVSILTFTLTGEPA